MVLGLLSTRLSLSVQPQINKWLNAAVIVAVILAAKTLVVEDGLVLDVASFSQVSLEFQEKLAIYISKREYYHSRFFRNWVEKIINESYNKKTKKINGEIL